jgi:hypothetical protein
MPIAEVYVRLGDPSAVNGGEYVWPAGPQDSGRVVAHIADGRLDSIACPLGEEPAAGHSVSASP